MATSYSLKRERSKRSKFTALFPYLSNLLEDRYVATLVGSSTRLCETVADAIDFASVDTLVEFGAGEGTVTRHLLGRLKPTGRLIAFETNQALAEQLKREVRDTRLIVLCESAERVWEVMEEVGLRADTVVSGIPFSMFSADTVEKIVTSTAKIMSPKGRFIVYQMWLPPFVTPARLESYLDGAFVFCASQRVFLNFPPLKVLSLVPK